jgi:tetratricopeptide (TPR) repeat protein
MMTILVQVTGRVRGEEAPVSAQDERLMAIAAAAATVLRQTPYHVVRAGDVAAAVRLPGPQGRSAVWLYNEVHNRRVLVALAAAHAWQEFTGQANWSPPGPIESVTAARSAVAAALSVIVTFHRAEHLLMTQVGYGIGDISTAEKRQLAAGSGLRPPDWPDSPSGRVAAAAWHGRCDVFSDFLRPVLRDCTESVTYLAESDVGESASRLSDVTFRTCLADRDGPVDLVARGLAALWFERDLTRLAGSLPRDLESSETALAAVARRRTDPRAEANANAVVVRVLLEAGTLHHRCVREARRTVSIWQHLEAEANDQAATTTDTATTDTAMTGTAMTGTAMTGTAMTDAAHDRQRLSDAASHLGLAAARYGDRRAAAEAWELSRRVTEQGLGHDRSRVARADNNLAALAAETGCGRYAETLITEVLHTRQALLERQPQDAPSWRRLTVTQRTRTDIARLNGRATESVRLAADLLADRRARLGVHADTAEARSILGQTLLSAGHPTVARRHLEEAADTRRGRFLPSSYRVQEDLIWLAKAALVLEHPHTVLDLLGGQAARTDWFRDRVSFRLGYTARRLLALASGQLGRADDAAATLRADREHLADCPLDAGLDPLAADLDRALAELALIRGEAAAAAAALTRLAEAEAEAETGPPRPAHGWTLVLLGRAADLLGDGRRAAECFGAVTDLTTAGVDHCHPVILTAHFEEAVRCAALGDANQASKLLQPVLDRTPLAHGRPALGEAHPLLAKARALAERLGVHVPSTPADLDEAALDIDA